jgi:hypothetical protein
MIPAVHRWFCLLFGWRLAVVRQNLARVHSGGGTNPPTLAEAPASTAKVPPVA